ncbi:MAG: flagellar hook-associated protein FlgL [Pseudohongiellaceae bacterium]|jgi:flagellar hook-associated protein 3 FlgL
MKIATNQYFLKLGRHLADQQADIATLQAKLATGDTMVTPGSEPRIAARSLELNSIIEKQQGFLDNLSRLDGRLMQEESVVTTMRTLVTRMQELTIRAASDTYADSDRAAIAVELRGYRDEILALANTTDPDGNYLFAGIRNSTQPFVEDANGVVVYQGDQTPTRIDVDLGHSLRINTTRDDVLPDLVRDADDPESRSRASVFRVFDDLIAAVASSDGAGTRLGLDELDKVASGIDRYTVDIGLRRGIVETKTDITTDRKLAMTNLLARERELDYATAVTELSSHMLSLEAAQSTIAKISQLTLFNYLR